MVSIHCTKLQSLQRMQKLCEKFKNRDFVGLFNLGPFLAMKCWFLSEFYLKTSRYKRCPKMPVNPMSNGPKMKVWSVISLNMYGHCIKIVFFVNQTGGQKLVRYHRFQWEAQLVRCFLTVVCAINFFIATFLCCIFTDSRMNRRLF